MFDRYIGLGLNCEVAVQLRRLTGRAHANVFDWQLTTQSALIHVLRNDFADYFRLENLVLPESRTYVLDTATGMQFHHLFPHNLDGTILPERMVRAYPRVRARAEHLIRRWHDTVNSGLSALYVRRDPDDELTADDMLELRDVLRHNYPTHRFALLWARDTLPADTLPAKDNPQNSNNVSTMDCPQNPNNQSAMDCPQGEVLNLSDGVYAARIYATRPQTVLWQGDNTAWDHLYPKLPHLSPLRRS